MNSKRLMEIIKEKRMSIDEVSQRIGISRTAFYRKLKGTSEFTISEITNICEVLGLTSPMGIFFTEKVP